MDVIICCITLKCKSVIKKLKGFSIFRLIEFVFSFNKSIFTELCFDSI